eukprot:3201007-Alexandrium_andersonii.AAC.1
MWSPARTLFPMAPLLGQAGAPASCRPSGMRSSESKVVRLRPSSTECWRPWTARPIGSGRW